MAGARRNSQKSLSQMSMHREYQWSPEEDIRLDQLVEHGTSWILISALLERSIKSIKERAQHLSRRRQAAARADL